MSALDETVHVRVAPGMEPLATAELVARGVKAVEVPGGVDAPLASLPDILLWSRIGSGVSRVLGRVPANQLPDSLKVLPWKRVLGHGQKVEVELRELAGRGLDKKCAAVAARGAANTRLRRGAQPACRVWLVNRGGKVDVAVEAAHELFKRGWREQPGRAPLRENLAAGVLAALGWNASEWLVDPMCGAGTFPIEAATMGLGRAPGAWRHFEAEWWPDFDAKAFEARRQAVRKPTGGTVRILGSDRDARQMQAAIANAGRARVERHIRLEQVAFEDLDPPADTGLVVMNPPYGERLASSEKTFRFIGGTLTERWKGWRYGVLSPDPSFARCLPGNPEVALQFRNGGIRVWLLRGIVPGDR